VAEWQPAVADLVLMAFGQVDHQVIPTPDFWSGKRVFLTGHTGFKGAWLAFWLDQLGAIVKGYSLAPISKPVLFNVLDISSHCESVLGDIRDRQNLAREISHFEPEIIFHLAAQPLVRHSYIHPVDTFQTNIMGSMNLLECCRQTMSIKTVLMITTDKVYENKENKQIFNEDAPLGGHDPYSASKAASELIASAYRKSFFDPDGRVRLVTIRAGNIIGGGDWSVDRLIPDCIRARETGKQLDVRYPHAIRPWQHVTDALKGYLTLAEKMTDDNERLPHAFNFGPNQQSRITVQEVLEMVGLRWKHKLQWHFSEAAGAQHEAGFLALDSSRAASLLGWKPSFDVIQSIDKTIDWYDQYFENPSLANIRAFTLSQISDNLSA
jgi:CDP-glucose 4,6-dehydratase